MKLKTVLVGVGGRGRWPVEVMGSDARFEIVAIVDFSEQFAEKAAQDLGLSVAQTFRSLGEALGAVESQAVVICTPTRTHAALAREAFAANQHVLVEKGMTFDWNEAIDLVKEADEAGVKFCVAQNYRYNPVEQTVSHLLSDKDNPHYPGEIAIVDMVHHRYRPEPRTLNYPFATVWDMSCHHVDLLSGWLGAVKRVTAHASNPPWSAYEHDADIAAFIEYESGAVCHYVLTHAATISDYRLLMQGDRGTLRAFDVPGVEFYPLPPGQLGSATPEKCVMTDVPRSEQGVTNDFLRYIQEGIEPGISGRNNLQTLLVCEMLVRSASQKRAIDRDEVLNENSSATPLSV